MRTVLNSDFSDQYIIPSRFLACSEDLLGSTAAAFEAYQRFLPWIVDDQIEINSLFDPRDFSPRVIELLQAQVEGRPLGSGDQAEIDAYHQRQKETLIAMVSKNKAKKNTGFDESKRSDQLRFVSTMKSVNFFTRSLQDAIYGVLLLLEGVNPGANSSMARAFSNGILRDGSPVAKILKNIDSYETWFTDHRNTRNDIKFGAKVSINGPPPDIGIGVVKISPEGGARVGAAKGFFFSDLANALEMSSGVIRAGLKNYATKCELRKLP